MIASQIVVCFAFFGLLGWMFESTYCSLVEKRWCNRGFLFGPVCPIYGAGAVAAILVFGGLFGLCGLGVVYVALPLARQVVAAVPPLAFELAALALTAVLAADTTLTVCTLTEVLAVVEGVQAEFDQRMQAAVETVPAQIRSGAERLREEGSERAGRLREGGAEYAERLREVAGHLSARQQHVLHNARRFRTDRMGAAARRLTDALDGIVRGRGHR